MRWVVERIPKGNEERGQGNDGEGNQIVQTLSSWRDQLWAPVFLDKFRPIGERRYHNNVFTSCPLETPTDDAASESFKQYANTFMPFVSSQTSRAQQLSSALLHRNAVVLAKELEKEALWSMADLDPTVRVVFSWLSFSC